MVQTVTNARIIKDGADNVSSIKVSVIGEYDSKQYEIKRGDQFMLESPQERFKDLKHRMVRVEDFEEIPAGYCIKVFHIEVEKELNVGVEELKSIFKKSSQ
ncbi:hypothetical protein [Marinilactibacillus kalidii]|uniref:hypothetical protein n=1 Tax=Marinilactibacillus kalidii TaxID=2820274 RepID=UPI001ABEDB42|nr:hypothetical protein [Marinilactibacillus kalidii]